MSERYANDRPSDCTFCYFWSFKKNRCNRRSCFYKLPQVKVRNPGCQGCPYGRTRTCIGWCTQKLLGN